MRYQIYNLTWRGIEIEARYCANNYNIIAHLEIEAINPPRARLPVTETGYRSHFHQMGTIEREHDGDVVACVNHWLDNEAKSKVWQQYHTDTRQGSLF